MVSRRDVLAVFTCAAWPALALAQSSDKPPRIGVLVSGSRESAVSWLQPFREALRGRGYADKPLGIELRFADGQIDRLPALADELIKGGVRAIVAADDSALAAAKGAAAGIPVVGASIVKPAELAAKQLEMLVALRPKLARVAVLMNPENSTHRTVFRNVGAAAEPRDIRVLGVEADDAEQIEPAFQAMRTNRVGAAVIAADGLFSQEVDRIAQLALRGRLPTVAALSGYAAAGGLLTYGHDADAAYRRAAATVDSILMGRKPADLQTGKIPLIVNRGTAKAIGVSLPQQLLKSADSVIG